MHEYDDFTRVGGYDENVASALPDEQWQELGTLRSLGEFYSGDAEPHGTQERAARQGAAALRGRGDQGALRCARRRGASSLGYRSLLLSLQALEEAGVFLEGDKMMRDEPSVVAGWLPPL